MASKMLKVVSKEIVKPSSSNHPKIHNLSFFDQMVPSFYVPLLFFYSNRNPEIDHCNISNVLKNSLLSTLSHYYPLAGRIKGDFFVECNDEGSLFIEAQMAFDLSEILKYPDDKTLKVLFPDNLYFKDSSLIGPIAVQVTYFKCRGISIGLCLCHKLMEMASMSSFIKDWASLARNPNGEIVSPEFTLGSIYPPLDLPILKQKPELPPEMTDCVTKRLVFDGSKIAKLKEMVAGQVPDPTRVEVVASLLYRSAILANAKASSSGTMKPSLINHVMNLRARVSPPVSERNKGNISGLFPVCARDEKEVALGFLVKEFRQGKTRFSDSCASASNNEELYGLILKTMKPISEYFDVECEVYSCQSWCRYPFYEVDFGWGKPVWVATVVWIMKNLMTLMDTKDGGIEAFIKLEERAMAVLETDQDLLSFGSINPCCV